MIRRALPACLLVFAATAASLVHERDALACGGCFHPPPPQQHPTEVESVVTDHRMVFSISTTQTVLWDQIRYSGNPSEFAWVLPVKPGARIELSHDEWMAALDQATRSQVTGPAPKQCPVTYPTYGGGGGGGGGGCAFGSASSDTNSSFGGGGDAGVTSADGGASDSGVVVIRQDVVGPYQTVTVRASAGEALQTWLTQNGFDVPAALEPTLAAYTAEGFDFIALKLRPGVGVRAMQPVRVVTAGADTSLPLRMIAAGIGAHVGLELYVITEGRYHPQNFPDVKVDFSQLAWDPYQQRSNFAQLEAAALASGDGRGWITEFAGKLGYGVSGLYQSTCMPIDLPPVACDASAPTDASRPSSDAASSDANDGEALDGDVGDALADASHADAATCTTPQQPAPCDDFSVATDFLHSADIWITRLKADLPAGALAVGDLRLEPAPYQQTMTNVHATETLTDPSYDPCPKAQASPDASGGGSSSGCACTTAHEDGGMGSYFLIAFTALVASTILRRRRA